MLPTVNPIRWFISLVGLFLAVSALAALSGPGRIDTVDAQSRYEVSRSLVDHGDSIIRDEASWFNVYKGRNGKQYTLYRFPQSGLGVAAIWAADATLPHEADGPSREMRRHFFFLLTSAFAGAMLAVTYALWFRRLGQSPQASILWALGGIVCMPSWYYSCTTFDDILGAWAIVLAVGAAWVGKDRYPLFGATVAGLALGWAVNVKPPLGIFLLPVLAAVRRSGVPWRKQLLPCLIVLFWVAAGVAGYKIYEWYKFPPGTTDPNQEFVNKFGAQFTANPLPALVSFAFSLSCGVFFYCPAFYLALRGFWTWRSSQRLFCYSIALASGLFVLSLCFLTFFKGEHSWGPRYWTPVFALWWIFVPAAVGQVRAFVLRGVLTAGAIIQVLGLAVDPTRLFYATPVALDYFLEYPWQTLDPALAHLVQRPREIIEVLTPHDREPQFAPAPLPTHGGGWQDPGAYFVAQLVTRSFTPEARQPLDPETSAFVTQLLSRNATGNALPYLYPVNIRTYHIYNSLRPWWISQRYLAEDQRPVNHAAALTILLGLGLAGLVMALARKRCGALVGQVFNLSGRRQVENLPHVAASPR